MPLFSSSKVTPAQQERNKYQEEDVEKKIPVKVKKEVEKIKKVERRRPVKNLPADKVLSYDLTRVIREVSMAGTITVAGADQKPVAFRVLKESRDTSNDEVKHTRMTISADPMEADSLETVKENAAKEVARASARASARAIRAWMRDVRTKAQQAAADTKMDQAEELYLQLIALGIPADDQLKRFFKTRYGQSLDDIFNPLSVTVSDCSSTSLSISNNDFTISPPSTKANTATRDNPPTIPNRFVNARDSVAAGSNKFTPLLPNRFLSVFVPSSFDVDVPPPSRSPSSSLVPLGR